MLSQDETPGSCGLNNCRHSTQLIARQATASVTATVTAILVQFAVFWLLNLAPHLCGIDCKKLLKLFRGFGRLRRLHGGIKYGCVFGVAAVRQAQQQLLLLG